MRRLTTILVFALLASTAHAFFIPLTTEQRVANATVIAIIKVDKVTYRQLFEDVLVVDGIYGVQTGSTIRVWDDTMVDEDGKEFTYEGRDPYFEEGKTYFIYLKQNEKGRLVTVQSVLDSLEVTGDLVELEGGEGTESLALKIERTKELLAKLNKPNDDGADRSRSDKHPKLHNEGYTQYRPYSSDQEMIRRKEMETVIIPYVEFNSVPVLEAVNTLSKQSSKYGGAQIGCCSITLIETDRERDPSEALIDLQEENISILEAIDLTCQQADLVWWIDERIYISSKKFRSRPAPTDPPEM